MFHIINFGIGCDASKKTMSRKSRALREAFRRQLNSRNWTYADLAKKLRVSVPTVKRWMTKDDIPFEKVLLAIDIFEMSLSDLDAEVKFKNADTRPQPRKSDELYLATSST